MDEEDETNVIAFRPRADGDRMRHVIRRTASPCRHRAKVLDGERRVVECATCAAVVDPFDALMDIASEERHVEMLVAERKRLQQELGAIRDETAKAKAARRRALT